MKKADIQNIRDEIILSALPEVVFNGWNWLSVVSCAKGLGHDEAMVAAVFPRKMIDVLDGFADMADREMFARLSDVNAQDLRVRDRVRVALMTRYEFLNQFKEAERQALQFWVRPLRKVKAAKLVWRTADRVWEWAGDTASDYNRYTKRGLLSGVIVSTTLAWLNDPSENMDNTGSFLDRRIENVMQLGKALHKFKGQKFKKASA